MDKKGSIMMEKKLVENKKTTYAVISKKGGFHKIDK
jgi:hypothetical protein